MRTCMISFLLLIVIYSASWITHVKGQTPRLQGSSPSVVRNEPFQFTCTIPGSGSLLGPLSLQSVTRVPLCLGRAADCQFNNSPGYTCECVNGQIRVFYMNITSASTDDEGTWRCQYNGVNSNAISLDVLYGPGITSVPTNKQVIENASPDIDCSSNITSGNPSTTSYKWTGPGGYTKVGAVLDRLVNRNQAGMYTCTANNTAGLSDTAQVNVTVQYAPAITSVPTKKNVTEYASPDIDCSSNITPGNPSTTTSYRWTGPRGYSKDGAVLDRLVNRNQGGVYTCTATTSAGLSDTAKVNIDVQYRPQRDMQKDFSPTIIRQINDTAALMATAAANPLPHFTWWRYDSGHLDNIDDATDYSVFSSDLQTHSRNYGTYALKMNNTFGESILLYTLSQAPSATGQSQPDRLGQVIGFGVSLPVVLVLVVIIVLMWRRNHPNSETVNEDQTETIEIQSQGHSTPNQDGAYASPDEHAPQDNEYEKLDMANTDQNYEGGNETAELE